MNKDESVHPLELTLTIEPEGAPTASLSVIRLQGNIMMGHKRHLH